MISSRTNPPGMEACEDSPSLGGGWQIIFADILAILIAMFVLIIAMQTRGTPGADALLGREDPDQLTLADFQEGADTDYLSGIFSNALRRINGGGQILVVPQGGEVVLSASAGVWDELSGRGSVVSELAALLDRLENPAHIRVYGQGETLGALALRNGAALADNLRASGFGQELDVYLAHGAADGVGPSPVELVVRLHDIR